MYEMRIPDLKGLVDAMVGAETFTIQTTGRLAAIVLAIKNKVTPESEIGKLIEEELAKPILIDYNRK